jgi:hypothetical protein
MLIGAFIALAGITLYVLNVALIRHYLKRFSPELLELDAMLPPPATGQEHLWEKTGGMGIVPKWVSLLGLLAIPVLGVGVIWFVFEFLRRLL